MRKNIIITLIIISLTVLQFTYKIAEAKNINGSDSGSGRVDSVVVSGDNNVSFGQEDKITGYYNVTIGQDCTILGDYNVSIGNNNSIYGSSGLVAGSNSRITGFGGIALGDAANTQSDHSISIGTSSTVTPEAAFGVALGAYSYSNRTTTSNGVYTISGADNAAILNTIKGNYGVLSIGDPHNGNGNNKDGAFTRQLTGVAAGIEDTDAVNIAQLKALDNISIKYDDSDKNNLSLGGADGTVIHNVADGLDANDAVNKRQLDGVRAELANIDERIQIVGAHAAALSALHPVPYNPYEPTTFSAGFGMYRNEQSVAVGVFHYVRENVLVNAGFSLNSDGDTMGRAGISFAIGKSGRKQPSMVKDVEAMQNQIIDLGQKLIMLEKTVQDLQSKNKQIQEDTTYQRISNN